MCSTSETENSLSVGTVPRKPKVELIENTVGLGLGSGLVRRYSGGVRVWFGVIRAGFGLDSRRKEQLGLGWVQVKLVFGQVWPKIPVQCDL